MDAFDNCVLGKKQQEDKELRDLYAVTHTVFTMTQEPSHYRGFTNTLR
jgi:hypothetical protein